MHVMWLGQKKGRDKWDAALSWTSGQVGHLSMRERESERHNRFPGLCGVKPGNLERKLLLSVQFSPRNFGKYGTTEVCRNVPQLIQSSGDT